MQLRVPVLTFHMCYKDLYPDNFQNKYFLLSDKLEYYHHLKTYNVYK